MWRVENSTNETVEKLIFANQKNINVFDCNPQSEKFYIMPKYIYSYLK